VSKKTNGSSRDLVADRCKKQISEGIQARPSALQVWSEEDNPNTKKYPPESQEINQRNPVSLTHIIRSSDPEGMKKPRSMESYWAVSS